MSIQAVNVQTVRNGREPQSAGLDRRSGKELLEKRISRLEDHRGEDGSGAGVGAGQCGAYCAG